MHAMWHAIRCTGQSKPLPQLRCQSPWWCKMVANSLHAQMHCIPAVASGHEYNLPLPLGGATWVRSWLEGSSHILRCRQCTEFFSQSEWAVGCKKPRKGGLVKKQHAARAQNASCHLSILIWELLLELPGAFDHGLPPCCRGLSSIFYTCFWCSKW